MRAAAFAVAATLAVAVAGGCSQPDLADASFVDGLRLLGVQAEPPEAPPGATVKLTAWTVNTHGAPITVTWSACLLPSNGVANNGCTDGTGNGLVGLGSGDTLDIVVPDVDPSLVGPPDASYGVYLPIVVHLDAGGDSLDGVYRLRLRVPETVPNGCTLAAPFSPHCAPNQNPVYVSIDPLPDDGNTTETHEGEIWALLPHFADIGEEYAIPGSSMPTVFERQTTQWFATAGSFPDTPVGGTAVQKWTIDRALPAHGGTIDLWIVGHDDRGGTAISHRGFILQ